MAKVPSLMALPSAAFVFDEDLAHKLDILNTEGILLPWHTSSCCQER